MEKLGNSVLITITIPANLPECAAVPFREFHNKPFKRRQVTSQCLHSEHLGVGAITLRVIAPCSCHSRIRALTRNPKHPSSHKGTELGISSFCSLTDAAGTNNGLTPYNRPIFFSTDGLHLSNKDLGKFDPNLEQPCQIAYSLDSWLLGKAHWFSLQ